MVTSSGLGMMPVAGTCVYSSTKSLASFLAIGLDYELKEKQVDCLAWYAGETSTNMLKMEAKGRVATPKMSVEGMLKDVGKESATYGCYKHAKAMGQFSFLPIRAINSLMFSVLSKSHAKMV